jgi:hypothetical protein
MFRKNGGEEGGGEGSKTMTSFLEVQRGGGRISSRPPAATYKLFCKWRDWKQNEESKKMDLFESLRKSSLKKQAVKLEQQQQQQR